MNTIEINNLCFAYQTGLPVIDEISFSIEEGQKTALIGCNGAGKSTLLSLLLGVLWPVSGDISVCGLPLERCNLAEIRAAAGMVFQNPDDQLFMPTIYDDVAFGPGNFGLDDIDIKTQNTLEQLGIAHLSSKPPYRLSGGEKRSAALATALVMSPKLLLMDEPTAFLDPRTKRKLTAILKSMDMSVLIATHDLEFVRNTCARVILLSGGRIAADGDTERILSDTNLMFSAGL